MEFNSQVCTTKEQSERLLALGLKKETADMMYQNYRGHCIGFGYDKHPKCITDFNQLRDVDIPAWSLHRLIEIFGTSKMVFNMDIYDSPYEEIIQRIEVFINASVFNKEYLE